MSESEISVSKQGEFYNKTLRVTVEIKLEIISGETIGNPEDGRKVMEEEATKTLEEVGRRLG